MKDLIEECLRIFHGYTSWRVIKDQWPAAAVGEQRRKMSEVINEARKTTTSTERDGDTWNPDAAAFLQRLAGHHDLWLENSDLKYLTLRVDTRDGSFILFNRDAAEIRIDRVLEAMRR